MIRLLYKGLLRLYPKEFRDRFSGSVWLQAEK